jgi:hypothetical protein
LCAFSFFFEGKNWGEVEALAKKVVHVEVPRVEDKFDFLTASSPVDGTVLNESTYQREAGKYKKVLIFD